MLHWQPVADNGSPVKEYVLEFSTDDKHWDEVSRGLVFEHTQPVKPHTKGSFRCRAVSDVGSSKQGTCSGTSLADVPDAVPKPWIVEGSITAHSMKVKWNVPESNGSEVKLYSLQCQAEGEDDWTEVCEQTKRTFVMEKLSPKKCYSFRVKALNDCGWGAWSEVCEETTLADRPAVPAVPWVQKCSITAQAMTVMWSSPEDNGSPITGFRLQQREHGSAHWKQVYGGEEHQDHVTGLKPNTTYAYRVAAGNEIGFSAWSEECVGKTKDWSTCASLRAEDKAEDELGLIGSFISNDAENDKNCSLTLQMSHDKDLWHDVASSQSSEVSDSLKDINQYFRLVIEHPSGEKRVSDILHLRLQEVARRLRWLTGRKHQRPWHHFTERAFLRKCCRSQARAPQLGAGLMRSSMFRI
eukprot:TRINITY_DN1695_c0_g1_i6.p1 TRINITY_DN1695_c0_g1~~TRINITY_DN1695_c0_g1_i6.p1  ORF type:complete len:411 (+),score=58.33 TRINITY_DN1695_c0_g1_i6:833-2065(+)